jgi:hypothetical protein
VSDEQQDGGVKGTKGVKWEATKAGKARIDEDVHEALRRCGKYGRENRRKNEEQRRPGSQWAKGWIEGCEM